jgi:hypothetical protein
MNPLERTHFITMTMNIQRNQPPHTQTTESQNAIAITQAKIFSKDTISKKLKNIKTMISD